MNTVVIFCSTDRPLQLDAALRSFFKHCKDPEGDPVKILYRATNPRQASLYRQLAREHPGADFIRQHRSGRGGVAASNSVPKHALDDLLPEGRVLLEGHDYVCVVPDLAFFTRGFSISFLADCLRRHPDALGCTFCFSYQSHWCQNCRLPGSIPEFQVVDTHVMKYTWADAQGCFAALFDCSAGIYRATDLFPLCQNGQTKNCSTALPLEVFLKLRPTVLCPDEPMVSHVTAGSVGLPSSYRSQPPTSPKITALRGLRFWKRRPQKQSAAPANGDHIDPLSGAFAAGRRIDLEALESRTEYATTVSLETVRLTPDLNRAVPLVSVVIPCYGQARYLPEAVASVVSQSFTDWELIIVNDGSPDDTTDAARRLIGNHPKHRIRLIEQKNGGLSHARNTGIRSARGTYILPLDADDWIASNMLELMVPVLMERPHVAIVYCDLRHFGAVEKIVQAPEYDFRTLCHRNGVSYCSLFRREAWESVGGYNRNMIWSYEDREFWIACGENGFFAKRVPEMLFNYRVKHKSMYTNAVLRDRENRARIVLNHPRLYSTGEVIAARAIWSNPNLGLPAASPKVSVIVLTCDRPAGLAAGLQSLVNQSFKDFEIILVNDGGIDVEHVLARLPHHYPLTHVRHAASRGIAASRNTGFRLASGKYVAWLDDKHSFRSDFIEKMVSFLNRTGARGACAQPYHYSTQREKHEPAAEFHDRVQPADNSRVPGHAPMEHLVYERALGIAVGDFSESLDTHADWDYWLRLSGLCRPLEPFDSGNHCRQTQPQRQPIQNRRSSVLLFG